MKLIIDIPDEYFKNDNLIHFFRCYSEKLDEVIKNGTPLPKSHGRLKDIDAFISKVQADRQHAVYICSWTADDVLNALTNSYAPTIIEADKE